MVFPFQLIIISIIVQSNRLVYRGQKNKPRLKI